MAGEVDYTALNAGQVPVVTQRFPDSIRKNAVFAVYYLAFDLDSPPFDNVDVRKALWYAINRDELTSTVLKDIAIPAKSILAPSYPGYQQKIADEAKFDPKMAQDELAKAGYPRRQGLPADRDLVSRAGRLQRRHRRRRCSSTCRPSSSRSSASTWASSRCRRRTGSDALLAPEEQLLPRALRVRLSRPVQLLRPVQDRRPSQLQLPGLRQAGRSRRRRVRLEQAPRRLRQGRAGADRQGALVPLVHPVTIAAVSDKLEGDGINAELEGLHAARSSDAVTSTPTSPSSSQSGRALPAGTPAFSAV